MAVMFDVTDNTSVDDQCCKNCKWWNPDLMNDKVKCHNHRSEKYHKKTKGGEWCWCWQKDRRKGQ